MYRKDHKLIWMKIKRKAKDVVDNNLN